jgi:hypothetical protein
VRFCLTAAARHGSGAAVPAPPAPLRPVPRPTTHLRTRYRTPALGARAAVTAATPGPGGPGGARGGRVQDARGGLRGRLRRVIGRTAEAPGLLPPDDRWRARRPPPARGFSRWRRSVPGGYSGCRRSAARTASAERGHTGTPPYRRRPPGAAGAAGPFRRTGRRRRLPGATASEARRRPDETSGGERHDTRSGCRPVPSSLLARWPVHGDGAGPRAGSLVAPPDAAVRCDSRPGAPGPRRGRWTLRDDGPAPAAPGAAPGAPPEGT